MNAITAIKKAMKNVQLTDLDIFTSSAFCGYIRTIIGYPCRSALKPVPPVHVLGGVDGSPVSQALGCTDSTTIYLNAGHPALDSLAGKDRRDRFQILLGVLVHEFGHYRFTDHTTMVKAQSRLKRGIWYPALPKKMPKPLADNRKDFEDWFSAHPGEVDAVIHCWHDIQNIVEDGYIEECLYHVMSGILIDSLNFLRQRQVDTMPSLAEYENALSNGTADMYAVVTSLLLQYSKYGQLGCNSAEDYQLPYVQQILNAKDYIDPLLIPGDVNRYQGLHLVFLSLWPVIREHLERKKAIEDMLRGLAESMQINGNNKSSPTPVSEDEDTGISSGAPERRKVICVNVSQNDADEEQGATDGSGNLQEDPSEGESGCQGSSSSKEEKDDGPASGSETQPGGSEGQSGASEKDQPSGSEADENSTSSSKQPAPQKDADQGKEKGYQRGPDTATEAKGTGTVTKVFCEDNTDAEELGIVLRNLTKELIHEKAVEQVNEDLLADLQREAKDIPYRDIHRNVDVNVTRITKVLPETRALYAEYMGPIEQIAKDLARKVLPLLKSRQQKSDLPMTGFFSGAKFDATRLVYGDYRYFKNNQCPAPEQRLAISVLIDESGSMSLDNRIPAARNAALALYLFASQCDIPCAVMGHTAYDSEMTLNSYAEFESPDGDDKYRLLNVTDRYNNRDGAAIQYLGHHLLERPEETKLLFVISDGRPNDYGYSGKDAEEDVTAVVSELRRRGLKVFSAAIGSDKECIQEMYGDGFLDITDITTMPQQMIELVKRYIR